MIIIIFFYNKDFLKNVNKNNIEDSKILLLNLKKNNFLNKLFEDSKITKDDGKRVENPVKDSYIDLFISNIRSAFMKIMVMCLNNMHKY